MDDPPLVSAIIATYNREHIVGEAIESILQQTYKNIEIVIVDDGSTDGTQENLKKYGDRIRVVHQENRGPAAAWNHGIQVARGEIIAFLGSDDIWLPTFVERQVKLLQLAGESVTCCLSNGSLNFANGKETTSFKTALLHPPYEEGVWLNVAEVISTRFVLFGQTVAIRRSALERTGGFDESLRYLEDYDMALRLSLQGPWGFIREPLVVWREGNTNSDSLSQEAKRNQIQLKQNVIKIHERVLQELQRTAQCAQLRKRLTRKLRKDHFNLAVVRLGQMNSRGARAIGHLLGRIDYYWYAVSRRSPWFPEMKTQPIDGLRS